MDIIPPRKRGNALPDVHFFIVRENKNRDQTITSSTGCHDPGRITRDNDPTGKSVTYYASRPYHSSRADSHPRRHKSFGGYPGGLPDANWRHHEREIRVPIVVSCGAEVRALADEDVVF